MEAGTWEYLGKELGYEQDPRLGENSPHQANYMIVCAMFKTRFGEQLGGDDNIIYIAAERAMVIGLEAWQVESGTKG